MSDFYEKFKFEIATELEPFVGQPNTDELRGNMRDVLKRWRDALLEPEVNAPRVTFEVRQEDVDAGFVEIVVLDFPQP